MSSEDFYKQLYDSLDKEQKDEVNCCLITDEPLTEYFVKLDCGHKFNYVPLYHDVANHKQKFNTMESNSGALKLTEIRCPYCRIKHPTVLPFYESLNLSKLNGVNAIFTNKMCAFPIPNRKYLPDEPLNYKFLKCKCSGLSDQEDAEFYCDKHKRVLAKEKKVLLANEKKEILAKKKEEIAKKKEEIAKKKEASAKKKEEIAKKKESKKKEASAKKIDKK